MIALLLGCLLVGAVGPVAAQDLRGRVENAGRGVEGVPVTLHRVTRDSSGVVAQTRTGAEGTFRFPAPPVAPEGFTVFFATADWQGIRYFGPPLHPTDPRSGYRVEVFDTIAARPGNTALRVARRDLIMLPEADGSWEINEVLRVQNTRQRTLVSADGLPTWEFRIPQGAGAFEVGEGGLVPSEIQRMGTRVLVTASLPPGEHDAVVRYRLPADRAAFTLDVREPISELGLLVREPAPRLRVDGLARVGSEQLAGESFARYRSTQVEPGTRIRIAWDGPSAAPLSPVTAALVAAGLVLAGGAGLALRGASSGR